MSYYASNGDDLQWLTTPEAARKLRVSDSTLRRMRDRELGLKSGIHYKRGLFKNTPIRWNVEAIDKYLEAHAYTPTSQG